MAIDGKTVTGSAGLMDIDKDRLQYKYLFGDCHTMTVALHELTGWPCVVYRDMSDLFDGEGLIVHSAVEIAGTNGVCLDAAGRQIILHDVARRYNIPLSDLTEEKAEIEFMNGEFGITDDGVVVARQYAEVFLSEFLPSSRLPS